MVGNVVHWDVTHGHAYFIDPTALIDAQGGKSVAYNGIGTMTWKLTRRGGPFNGSAWACGANSLLAMGGAGQGGQGRLSSVPDGARYPRRRHKAGSYDFTRARRVHRDGPTEHGAPVRLLWRAPMHQGDNSRGTARGRAG